MLLTAGAHLAALPNKIDMAQSAYFTAQDIYRGWAVFGFVLMAAILADLALAVAARARRTRRIARRARTLEFRLHAPGVPKRCDRRGRMQQAKPQEAAEQAHSGGQ
jgi:hypothetical protein